LKISREIKTAILVIASLLLFIWGYSFLKGTDLLMSYNTYYVEYDEVEGLASSAPVTINGLVIGKVSEISYVQNSWRPMVEIQIDKKYTFSKSSIARMYEPGLIGGKQIQIIPGQGNELAANGDTLIGDIKQGLTALVTEKLSPLQEKIEKMMVSADSLLLGLNEVLDVKTKQNLRNSMAKLSETLNEFSQTSKTVNDLLAENKTKLSNTVTSLEKTTANFSNISDTLATANISGTIKNLEDTFTKVDQMLGDIKDGKGTLGKLITDESIYNNFNKTSKELELLLQDLRLYPNRYINVSLFGKKNRPYVVPEMDPAEELKNQ
jgi:phospholipid/cholesterol/gamma-HCH transport system substrate-binding protein